MYQFGLEVICETATTLIARNKLASHVGRKFWGHSPFLSVWSGS